MKPREALLHGASQYGYSDCERHDWTVLPEFLHVPFTITCTPFLAMKVQLTRIHKVHDKAWPCNVFQCFRLCLIVGRHEVGATLILRMRMLTR